VSWQINANLGRHLRADGDAHGWLWEIARGDQVARIAVEITAAAWSSDPLSLPNDTRRALETDGRTELVKLLGQDDPARVVRCDLDGCTAIRT
jgi:hypothetical protein